MVDRDPLGAEHGERVAEARGGLRVAAGEDGSPPVVELDDQRSHRSVLASSTPAVTSPWARRTSPSLLTALPVASVSATTVANVPLRSLTSSASRELLTGSAERTRWFFSKMTRSPTLNALAPILISAPSSPAAWRRARTISFSAATSDRRTARMAVVCGAMDAPPVLHDALAGLVRGGGDRHPAVFDIGVDRGGDVAVAEGDEGVTFPLLVRASLAAVNGQGDDMTAELARKRAQRPTGVDGGELAVVAE